MALASLSVSSALFPQSQQSCCPACKIVAGMFNGSCKDHIKTARPESIAGSCGTRSYENSRPGTNLLFVLHVLPVTPRRHSHLLPRQHNQPWQSEGICAWGNLERLLGGWIQVRIPEYRFGFRGHCRLLYPSNMEAFLILHTTFFGLAKCAVQSEK